MNQCNQTKISRGFSLIIDDSGHRKSGNFTEGVGRQYIGEIGKTETGVGAVTSHLYDGIKSLPLDVELYQKADSFPQGNVDPEFKKKPEIALSLVDKTLALWKSTRDSANRCGVWKQHKFFTRIVTKEIKVYRRNC